MAVTITRTARIDDDGTGTTGTVINNAEKTSLYNEIDTALAKVAQLAGGNAFTGNQSIAGTLTVTVGGSQRVGIPASGELLVNTTAVLALGQVSIATDMTGHQGITIQNLSASNTGSFLYLVNSALGVAGSVQQTGPTTVAYNTSSDARLKDDDGVATDLSALRAVVIHDFRWTADGTPARGVFAQEAAAVFPSAITAGTNETTAAGTLARPWMTDYSKFVPDLIVGWQQHDAALTELRAILAAVKG